eukprot:scaffold3856_cov169-Amphora_coffeaeformis.AAC.7
MVYRMSGSATAAAAQNSDVVIADATPVEATAEVVIANKVKAELGISEFSVWVDKDTKFCHDSLLSFQLVALVTVQAYQITSFHQLDGVKVLNSMAATLDKDTKRVTLIGNPGTGKSWYQVYVLPELLHNPSGYKYIIRQVGKLMDMINLEQCSGYQWQFKYGVAVETILDQVKDAVYMYEPAQEKELPSLATLSPYSIWITEYKKTNYIELYFWPWSFSTMNAMAQDSERAIDDLEELCTMFWQKTSLRQALNLRKG